MQFCTQYQYFAYSPQLLQRRFSCNKAQTKMACGYSNIELSRVLVFCLKNVGPLATQRATIEGSDQTAQMGRLA